VNNQRSIVTKSLHKNTLWISAMFCGYLNEWRLGMYSLEDTTSARLSLEKTFKPAPKIFFGVVKLAITVWVIEVIIHVLVTRKKPQCFFYFLTNWQLTTVLAYFLFSLLTHTCLPVTGTGGEPNIYARITWTLYVISLNLSFVILLLYWFLEFNPIFGPPTYIRVMTHGGVFLFTLLDGMIINRIPIRLKQFIWYWSYCFVYLVWNVIHGYSPLGNPEKSDGDPDSDDDAIYTILSWKNRPKTAAVVSVLVLFVATPLLFHILWLVSKLFKPRYSEQRVKLDDDEEAGEA